MASLSEERDKISLRRLLSRPESEPSFCPAPARPLADRLCQYHRACVHVTFTLSDYGSRATYITSVTVCCYTCSFIIAVNHLLCLLYKLNFIVGMDVLGKNIVYTGFCTIQGFRHPLGILGCIAQG